MSINPDTLANLDVTMHNLNNITDPEKKKATILSCGQTLTEIGVLKPEDNQDISKILSSYGRYLKKRLSEQIK